MGIRQLLRDTRELYRETVSEVVLGLEARSDVIQIKSALRDFGYGWSQDLPDDIRNVLGEALTAYDRGFRDGQEAVADHIQRHGL